MPEDVTVVCDMCIPGYWLAAMHAPPGPAEVPVPMGWGTLGYVFPAALGAATAGPTLSVSGDGGFLFACSELATAKQENLPLTALVVDDGGYGMLRFDQPPRGRRDLRRRPDDARLRAARQRLRPPRDPPADGLDRVAAALAEHLADPEPSLLVARAQLTPPPTTSPLWHRQGPPAWADPLQGL